MYEYDGREPWGVGVLVIIFLLNYAQLSLQIRGGETENSSQPSTPVMQTQEKKCKAMQLWADAETEEEERRGGGGGSSK